MDKKNPKDIYLFNFHFKNSCFFIVSSEDNWQIWLCINKLSKLLILSGYQSFQISVLFRKILENRIKYLYFF